MLRYLPMQTLSMFFSVKQASNLFRAGLLKPRDSTSFTAGMSTNTGIAFSINDFMAQLKVNDSCGLISIFVGSSVSFEWD
jgi:hypothetical protein